MTAHPMLDALRGALKDNDRVVLLGEAVDLSPATTGLRQASPGRVQLLPAADATLVGVAIGMALGGALPVVELAGPSALWGALQQIGQDAAVSSVPVVIRVPIRPGDRLPLDLLCALDGVRLLSPSCAAEAPMLLRGALDAGGPVVIIEPQAALSAASQTLDPLPLSHSRRVREGQHATVIAWGVGLRAAMDAAVELSQDGVEVDVIDLRSLNPLDTDTLAESVQRTGHAVIVDGPATVLSALTEHAFLRLESPPAVVPADPEAIAQAVRAALIW